MNTNIKLLLLTLPAVAALALILMQQSRVGALEKRLAETGASVIPIVKDTPKTSVPAVSSADTLALAAIHTRLDELDRKVSAAAMLARTATRSVAAASPDTLAMAADDSELPDMIDEVASLRADVDALLQGRGVEAPEARKTIRDELATARSEARAERETRREENRAKWLTTFAEESGLTETQTEALMEAEVAFRDKRAALRESIRAGEKDRNDVQGEIRAARDEMNATLRESLGEDHFKALEESRSQRRPGRRTGDRPVPRPSE